MRDCDERIVRALEDGDYMVRYHTLKSLGKMDPEVIAGHAACITPKFADPSMAVRYAAVETLQQLGPEPFSRLAAELDVGSMLRHKRARFCILPLMQMVPALVESHSEDIVAMIRDRSQYARLVSADMLSQVRREVLLENLDCLVRKMHESEEMRDRIAVALSKLRPMALAPYIARIPGGCPQPLVARARWALARRRFWALRLIWYWASRSCGPGSMQAREAAREFGVMTQWQPPAKRVRGAK